MCPVVSIKIKEPIFAFGEPLKFIPPGVYLVVYLIGALFL
jgi:hypothetical protein